MTLPAAIALLALAAVPAFASDSKDYGQLFVDSFAEACVPERLSYPATRSHAESLGWTTADPATHPELAAMMAKMEAAIAEDAEELGASFEHTLYSKPIAGVVHHLVVSRSSFILDPEEDPPNPWVLIGCHLYNFDATAPIDPAPMTALIGKPISRSVDEDGLVSHLWGPPCPMPRTGDSYLTFVADGSKYAGETGFSGLMVKFETSEPDPGEVVPETYC